MREESAEPPSPMWHSRSRDARSSGLTSKRQFKPPLAHHRTIFAACGVISVLWTINSQAEWPAPQTATVSELSTRPFWPDDPDYAYGSYGSSEIGQAGQWWLYSFVPERAPTAPPLQRAGLASGLSVDAAWRFSTGKPTVLLAFLDDGIDWASDDLRRKIALNPLELVKVPPAHLDQSPCAPLIPGDSNSPRIDCSDPPDGVVTIDDYVELLHWKQGDPKPPTDPNGNKVLDPGDIVLLNQNSRDDDGNGLGDDIAGWNFVENNPFPYHLTTSNGTEVALDAVAQTNNGTERAGACPDCLGIPIRVADQRGTDPQLLALAILYAASRGATAALVGHLPLGRSETLDRALQNAVQRGTLILVPQDGEQQNRSPLLLDLDSWLPVGTLTTRRAQDSTIKTTSFVALDPCQSLGPGYNFVGSGPWCSRRAPAIVLGIAGLVSSAAAFTTNAARLTPSETASILKWSSDAIDDHLTNPGVQATSAEPAIRRINAQSAVDMTRAGLVPPELDVERPYWYEPLVPDRLKSPLPIIGRLSAVRAGTVDLRVSAAAGSQPDDTDFQTLLTQRAISGTALALAGSTLATIDLSTWYNTTRSAIADSKESGTVVTVRIKATAHYGASAVSTAEVERRIVVLEDEDLLDGAPLRIGSTPTAPKLADVNDDGIAEIIFGTLDGRLFVLSARDGRLADLPAKPILTKQTGQFADLSTPASILDGTPAITGSASHSPIAAAPAIGDLDGDGRPEIVFASLDGDLYAVHDDGTSLRGWWPPIQLPNAPSICGGVAAETPCLEASPRLERGVSSSPVLADVNGDGWLEVVVAAHDGRVHAYRNDGTPVAGWPVLIGAGDGTQPGRLTQSPSVGDFDGNRSSDLVVTAGEERTKAIGRGMHVLLLGSSDAGPPLFADGWPVGVDTCDVSVDKRDRTTPGTSIDGSGQFARALLYGNSRQPFFLPIAPGVTQEMDPTSPSGQLPSAAEPVSPLDGQLGFSLADKGLQSPLSGADDFAPMLGRPSLGDLDRDGTTDLVLAGISQSSLDALQNSTYAEKQAMLAFWSGATGRMLPAAPVGLDAFVGPAGAAIADITNDGYPEVIIGSGGDRLIAIDACGTSPAGWPKVVGDSLAHTPAIGNIDDDDALEVVAVTENGWLYAWHTEAKAGSYLPWASELNDNLNQSNYQTPSLNSTPGPLRLDASGRCFSPVPSLQQAATSPRLSARGGCSCYLASVSRGPTSALVTILGALTLLCASRRARNRRN